MGESTQYTVKSNPWLFHPVFDLLTVGGLSLLLYGVLQAVQFSERTDTVIMLGLWGSYIVNYPHYAATYYRVYRSGEEVKKYAFETLAVPAALLGLCISSLFYPALIAPWLVKAYFILSGFHYSGQTYGISMVYLHKQGVRLGRFQKYCFSIPIYASYVWPIIRAEVPGYDQGEYFGVMVPVLGLPEWMVTVSQWVFYGGCLGFVGMFFYYRKAHQVWLPMVVLLVMFSQLAWYVFSYNEAYQEFVPFFHCLQYLMITTYYYYKEVQQSAVDSGGKAFSALSFFQSFPFIRYYAILVGVGAFLFEGIPLWLGTAGICTLAFGHAIADSFVNLHHFILDGAIWRLRKSDVRKTLTT